MKYNNFRGLSFTPENFRQIDTTFLGRLISVSEETKKRGMVPVTLDIEF